MPSPEELAAYGGAGYVIAPAGFGKTHLIAEAVKHATARQLILTHTYAGVNAMRAKLRKCGVPSRHYRLDTIASWSLRLVLSYSRTSGWTECRPHGTEWKALYGACARLLECDFIQHIVRASYAGAYVDEYQDCSVAQHGLIVRLAALLPCRLLGDPLQSIFDFDEEPVDWNRDVATSFALIGGLHTPHRWLCAGAPQIGEWIADLRIRLLAGQTISLDNRPAGIALKLVASPSDLAKTQGNTCRFMHCDVSESVVAIHKGAPEYKAKCHRLARAVGGRFSSIEEIEGRTLLSRLGKIQNANSRQKQLKEIVDFAADCMTAVKAHLAAATQRGERAVVRQSTQCPDLAFAANRILDDPTSGAMADLLRSLEHTDGVGVFRRDLYNRMQGVLRKHALNPAIALLDAAEKYQAEFRYKGRPAGRRLIGTTLLVKGLEFDHAIVLDAGSLATKDLYVALTRGSKSLTIVSTSGTLNPGAAP